MNTLSLALLRNNRRNKGALSMTRLVTLTRQSQKGLCVAFIYDYIIARVSRREHD
jgi:hypothetical protein